VDRSNKISLTIALKPIVPKGQPAEAIELAQLIDCPVLQAFNVSIELR
jgi:hypothetical protein